MPIPPSSKVLFVRWVLDPRHQGSPSGPLFLPLSPLTFEKPFQEAESKPPRKGTRPSRRQPRSCLARGRGDAFCPRTCLCHRPLRDRPLEDRMPLRRPSVSPRVARRRLVQGHEQASEAALGPRCPFVRGERVSAGRAGPSLRGRRCPSPLCRMCYLEPRGQSLLESGRFGTYLDWKRIETSEPSPFSSWKLTSLLCEVRS